MDEDTVSLILTAVFIIAFVSFPFILILSIQTCVAYSRTRAWQRAKTNPTHPESANLVINTDADSEFEFDPEDSGDEAEFQLREEERKDLTLTFRQKFRKELARAIKGDKAFYERQRKLKEREERQKLAKEVARELVKMERRKQRKGNGLAGEVNPLDAEGDGEGYLPSYHSAMSGGHQK